MDFMHNQLSDGRSLEQIIEWRGKPSSRTQCMPNDLCCS